MWKEESATAPYDDKQGRRQYITEIYVDNMEMLSTRPATKEQ